MSITQRVKPDNNEFPEMLLVEPEVADLQIAQMFPIGDYESVRVFCEILLIIEKAIDGGERRDKIIETIDLYLELAFLQSMEYSNCLTFFRKHLQGELIPGSSLSFEHRNEPKAEPEKRGRKR